MRFFKALIFGLSLVAAAGTGFAGEDSTHRENCRGTNYWEMPGGLHGFAMAEHEC